MSRTLQIRLMARHDGAVQFCSGECNAQGHGNGYTFFRSRWLIQINPMETVTESTVLTSSWLPAACLNRVDESQWCS